jgi:hypothetical protein
VAPTICAGTSLFPPLPLRTSPALAASAAERAARVTCSLRTAPCCPCARGIAPPSALGLAVGSSRNLSGARSIARRPSEPLPQPRSAGLASTSRKAISLRIAVTVARVRPLHPLSRSTPFTRISGCRTTSACPAHVDAHSATIRRVFRSDSARTISAGLLNPRPPASSAGTQWSIRVPGSCSAASRAAARRGLFDMDAESSGRTNSALRFLSDFSDFPCGFRSCAEMARDPCPETAGAVSGHRLVCASVAGRRLAARGVGSESKLVRRECVALDTTRAGCSRVLLERVDGGPER